MMALRPATTPLGPPWRHPLKGRFEELVVESEALIGNPLGDPTRRPLYVYSSPGVVAGMATDVAAVYVLQGYSGQLDGWLARKSFELTFPERLDEMFSAETDPCPDAVVVFVDAWTSLGGSQFLNSAATGKYTDYICDEVVAFIDATYPTAGTAARRAVTGHSSGGYGALVLPMLRPGVFGGLIAHAPDTLFEACYLSDFARVVRTLRDSYDGSYEALLKDMRASDTFDWGRWGEAANTYAMAAAYSPDLERPGEVLLPFDTNTGVLIDEVWQRWLTFDPVRMAPLRAEALRELRHIHLEVGRGDEYMLDVGTLAFADQLTKLNINHTVELFDGGHGGNSRRYGPAIRTLLQTL
jgi:enterochelin esterase-like enzyme